MGCQQVLNIIRSCSRPFPGAFIKRGNKIFRIWSADIETSGIENPKGCFVLNDKLIIELRDGHIVSEDYEVCHG